MKNNPINNALYHCIDGGLLEVIGEVTIYSATVNLYRCSVCGKEYDDSNYDSIANLEDCAEIKKNFDMFYDNNV